MNENKIEEKRQEWCKRIPQMYQKNYQKAMKGRSLKSAVKAKCLECANWQKEGIKKCLIPTCPLFPYRPYQKDPWKAHKGIKTKTSYAKKLQ